MTKTHRFLGVICALLVACAPAANPPPPPPTTATPPPPAPPPPPRSPQLLAALERFPIKDGERWQLTAVSPDGKALQRYTLALSADSVESDGLLLAQGSAVESNAARHLASLVFTPTNGALLIVVTLGAERDPATVACSFSNAVAGRIAYQGQSFFGRFSEVERLSALPASRLGNCSLEKS